MIAAAVRSPRITPKPPKKKLLPLLHASPSEHRPSEDPSLALPLALLPAAATAQPRTLRLVLGRTPSGARRLLAASLLPAIGCAASHEPTSAAPPEDGALAAPSEAGQLDAGAHADARVDATPPDRPVVAPSRADAAADASGRVDPRYPFDVREGTGESCGGAGEVIYAQLPAEGVPAEVDQICARPATELLRSGWAARLLVDADPSAVNLARGVIEIAPELEARVLDAPVLRIESMGFQRLQGDYTSYGYVMRDARAELMFRVLRVCLHERAFAFDSLLNRLISLSFARQVHERFFPGALTIALSSQVRALIEIVQRDTLDVPREVLAFARDADAADAKSVRRFATHTGPARTLRSDGARRARLLSAPTRRVCATVSAFDAQLARGRCGLFRCSRKIDERTGSAPVTRAGGHVDQRSTVRGLMAGLLVGTLLVPVGCNEGESDTSEHDAGQTPDGGGPADAGDGSDASDDAAAASRSPGCGSATVSPGDHDESLEFGGKTRAYRVHVPADYSGEPTPVVINMHGFLSTYMEQVKLTGMSEVADREGFIVVYPAGAGEPAAWNAGECCEYVERDRDDVGFIEAVLDAVEETACVDLGRVYATGFSNGGFLSHRIGCELSDRFAAIATVSAVLGMPPEECEPGRSLPVLQIHGDADPTIPYAGGAPMGWELLYPDLPAPNYRSVMATADFWREQSGCADTRSASYDEGDAKCESYDDCDHGSGVTICTISGGGHTWPGGDTSAFEAVVSGIPVTTLVGATSTSLDASSYIWEFFARHPMP